jgi:hypothetical protein
MTLLLLSGRPGAGKTPFGKWLEENRGFTHIETDKDAGLATLNALLGGFQGPGGAAEVRAKARALGEKVVIEWGFMIEDFGWVRQLQAAGFDAWWLDGDEQAARQGYINKTGGGPAAMKAYWNQVKAIEAARPALERFYGNNIVCTVTSGTRRTQLSPLCRGCLQNASRRRRGLIDPRGDPLP